MADLRCGVFKLYSILAIRVGKETATITCVRANLQRSCCAEYRDQGECVYAVAPK